MRKINFYEDNSVELYNLKEDISEQNNILSKEPDSAENLFQKLTEWINYAKAKLPKIRGNSSRS